MPGDAGGETTVIKRPAQREDRWFWNRVDKVTLPGRRSNGEGDKETMKPRLASADLKGPSSLVDVRSTTKQGPNNTQQRGMQRTGSSVAYKSPDSRCFCAGWTVVVVCCW